MKVLFLILFFSLSACSRSAFRKEAYSVRETPISGILLVHVSRPIQEDLKPYWFGRIAGEECEARHFSYFDYGLARDGDIRVFCYPKPTQPNLGIVPAMKAAASSPAELRVEDTLLPAHNKFRAWDVIRKVNGREVHDVAEYKESVFLAAKQGLKSVSILVERSEIPLHFDVSIADDAGQLLTPETLTDLRSKIP